MVALTILSEARIVGLSSPRVLIVEPDGEVRPAHVGMILQPGMRLLLDEVETVQLLGLEGGEGPLYRVDPPSPADTPTETAPSREEVAPEHQNEEKNPPDSAAAQVFTQTEDYATIEHVSKHGAITFGFDSDELYAALMRKGPGWEPILQPSADANLIAPSISITTLAGTPARGFEDQGMELGVLNAGEGIPIALSFDVGETHEVLSVAALLIEVPTDSHGTFYYQGVPLTITADGRWFVVPPSALQSTEGTHYRSVGITFVPAPHWSDASNGGEPLQLGWQVQLEKSSGELLTPSTGSLFISVAGVADAPLWEMGGSQRHYSLAEDGAIPLTLLAITPDVDGSETVSYLLRLVSGLGALWLDGQLLVAENGRDVSVLAADIGRVQLVPQTDFSGDIRVDAMAVSHESAPVEDGLGSARGVPLQLIFNVQPVADGLSLGVTSIEARIDERIDLASHIGLSKSADSTDGSEELYLRLGDLPTGAVLLLGGVPLAADATGHYEVLRSAVTATVRLELVPPPHSNRDFSLTIEGEVKDHAMLTDATGQGHRVESVQILPGQLLGIDLPGELRISDGTDPVINLVESQALRVQGVTEVFLVGQAITLTLTDQQGQHMELVTRVQSGGLWEATFHNLTGQLAEGPLRVQAFGMDKAGNLLTDEAVLSLDTRAGIDIDDLDAALLLGNGNASLSGQTFNVEAGQEVTLSLVGKSGALLLSASTLVASDGSWRLDGLDLGAIAGPYEVRAETRDLAGNRVADAAPLFGPNAQPSLSEVMLAGGAILLDGTLNTGGGQDAGLRVSFAPVQGALESLALSSLEQPLRFEVSDHILTASAGSTLVFTLALTDAGTYHLQWYQSLDHDTDLLTLPFALEYRDSDGDLVRDQLRLDLQDGAPLGFTIGTVTLTEAGLTVDSPKVAQTTFVIPNGGDPLQADGTQFVDQAAALARLNGSALSSGGHLLSFVFISPQLLEAFYLDGGGKRVTVLSLALSALQQGADVAGTLVATLHAPFDEPQHSLALSLGVGTFDSDGDPTPTREVLVEIADDAPTAIALSHTLVEQGGAVFGDLLPDANQGADGARVTALRLNGQTYGVNGTLELDVKSPDGQAIMGHLSLGEDGGYRYQPNAGYDYGTAPPSLVFDIRLEDGDGDSAEGSLTLYFPDPPSDLGASPALGIEEQGTLDPSQGIPIQLTVDMGDLDRGEFLSELLIGKPAIGHGSFYYHGTALAVTADGKGFIVPVAAMQSTDGVHYQSTGLTFVPDANWSDASNGGAPLSFGLQLSVGVTQGTSAQPITGTLNISVQGVADEPVWDLASTRTFYSLNEEAVIPLQLAAGSSDTDGSESTDYLVKLTEGEGSLRVNGALRVADANGYIRVTAAEVAGGKLTLVPKAAFSGDIRVEALPLGTEAVPAASGLGSAQGAPLMLLLNVKPVADSTTLTVTNAEADEDSLIDLGRRLGLTETSDRDGSESRYLRIEGLPAGSLLLLGGAAVAPGAGGVYEVPYAAITPTNRLELQPPPNSNQDFSLSIKGVVKDVTTLTDAGGGVQPQESVRETTAQVWHLDLHGVPDSPLLNLTNSLWHNEGTADAPLYVISIPEDGRAALDFSLLSGEVTLSPGDGSESLNLVLTGLSQGVRVFDANGAELELHFAGLDGNGQPTYQVDVVDIGTLRIQPPENSTEEMILNARIVVTENDGASRVFEVPLHIRIEPVVDVVDAVLISQGVEDLPFVLNWAPSFADSAEQVTSLRLYEVPAGYRIFLQAAGGGLSELPLGNGELRLTPPQLASLLAGGQLLVQGPEDSDLDVGIKCDLGITQDQGGLQVVKLVTESLQLDIRASIESDDVLSLVGGDLVSTDGSAISLTGRILFTNQDLSSLEAVDHYVIELPLLNGGVGEQFVVTGALFNGNGSWLVPQGALDNVRIQAPAGFTGVLPVKVHAMVIDPGEDDDPSLLDPQAPSLVSLATTVNFQAAATTPSSLAASVDILDGVLQGSEDQLLDLGSQLRGLFAISATDQSDDMLTLVIGGIPAGASIDGAEYNEVSGEYILRMPPSLVGLDALTLALPADFAGSFNLAIRLVNIDGQSGDLRQDSNSLRVDIAPVLDVAGGPDGAPVLTLIPLVEPKEETQASLSLAIRLADLSPSLASGLETVERVTLSVDPLEGQFLNDAGELVSTLVITDLAALAAIGFLPAKDVSGQLPISVQVDIKDSALLGGILTEALASWSGQVVLTVAAVNDPALVVVNDVAGIEGGVVNLGGSVQVQDPSEAIVSLQIKGVPAGFILSAPAVNNGGGVWQLPVGSDLSSVTLRAPSPDFSGSVELVLGVYTQDTGGLAPSETTRSFVVTFDPVGDPLTGNLVTSASGNEGAEIALRLDLATTDKPGSIGAANVVEHGPEQVRVTLSHVPLGAQIRLPDGIAGKVLDLGGGNWQITSQAGVLATLLLVTQDQHGSFDIALRAQSVDSGALGPALDGSIRVTVNPEPDLPDLLVDHHSILALQGDLIPFDFEASVINPAPGELRLRLSGLDGAEVVDGSGNLVGSDLGGGHWLFPVDQNIPLFLRDLTDGDHQLILTAESSIGGSSLSSQPEIMALHVQSDPELQGTTADDLLLGRAGDERLDGGGGSDILRGGAGSDVLSGGAGDDRFEWHDGEAGIAAQPALDVVTDYHSGDVLDISDLLHGVPGAGSAADLQGYLSLSVQDPGNGLSTLVLSVAPSGDGIATQEIDLQNVDLAEWGLAPANPTRSILQTLLDDGSLLVIP